MSPPKVEIGVVEGARLICDGTWELAVRAPYNAAHSRAGQFVHVRVGEGFQPPLRRPLSVGPCEGDVIRLIFTVRGRGTLILAGKSPGDRLDLIGPLWTPFRPPDEGTLPLLVAGGIGVVPLLLLDDQLPRGVERRFLLGARSRSRLAVDRDEIARRGILPATEDDTLGFAGDVVQLFERQLDELGDRRLVVYGCGPGAMLAALKGVCSRRALQGQVSLEVSMGCGVGACQSCAVPKSGADGYRLVCSDGPVFDLGSVDLEAGRLP